MGFCVALFSIISFISSTLLPAQDSRDGEADLSRSRLEQLQIMMEFDNIQLTFLVRDPAGNFIRNLSPSDFLVQENGQEMNVLLLREQEVPISAVVMVDTSYSIGSFLQNAANTAVDFFKGLENESAAFVAFSDEARVILDWEDEARDISEYARELKPDGKTALYDSVIRVADEMLKPRSGKKLIVLLTDGIDTMSESTFQDMIRATRDAGVTLYPIIYTNQYIESYRRYLRTDQRRITSRVSRDFHNLVVLQDRFVDQSLRYGGRTIFSNAFNDLKDIYGQIIHEMKSQYVMLYQSAVEEERAGQREVRVSTRRVPGKIFIDISN